MIKKAVQLSGAQLIRDTIESITGDKISNDDVFGAISGAILNPNTELLFSAVDMRNFQLQFTLVPRNSGERDTVNEIAKIFKMCTLPKRDPGKVFGGKNDAIDAGFIGVPNLCRVSFMRGAQEHDVLPRYKMCAVTATDVNYTPDGTYATYRDGQPVAMQLKINFQENKIVFADEPSGNLDSENSKTLYNLFYEVRKKIGCSFLIVTHDLKIADMSDRKIVLKDGKIINES